MKNMNEPAQQKLIKNRFRVWRRGRRDGVYYIQDNQTGERRSLKTKDKKVAEEFRARENLKSDSLLVQLEIGKVYLRSADPVGARRTWQDVMNEFQQASAETTRQRYLRAWKETAFDIIRTKPLVETTAD